MITTLAFRHLLVRKFRSLFLLLGFSLGVSVMIVLLSVGEAMLAQSRDASLVGGGELTVLPQGIDIEAMRTGGIGSMFFGIDRARFLVRQSLGGPRQREVIKTVSPGIEGKLLYLRRGSRMVPVRAGGEIPSRARSVGAGLRLLSGSWTDSRSDSVYIAPSKQQLYDELDRFHLPGRPDSTWAEWQYYNVVVSPREWWYITYLVGGEVPTGRWGGELLLTHRSPDGSYSRFVSRLPATQVRFDTARADLAVGRSVVRQRNGVYHLEASSTGADGQVTMDLAITPAAERYFPPVELRDDEIISGYVVPGLVAAASGKICVRARCTSIDGSPAYHDHNWGVWRDVTWEWGNARGQWLSFLYGGIYASTRESGPDPTVRSPFFLSVLDSLGVKQVLRFDTIRYAGARPVSGAAHASSPEQFTLTGVREGDTLNIHVQVLDALATQRTRSERTFLQMRGHFTASGRLLGAAVSDSGSGFFETYVGPN